MIYYSTKRQSQSVDFEKAIFQGLPPDNGLYMPESIPVLSNDFWGNCQDLSFSEIAFEVSRPFINGLIPDFKLRQLIDLAYDFEAPLVELAEDLYCLELFHGPSMAFKDFGARFMAGIMSYFLKLSGKKVNILVATSGDTGGAVAQGFFGKENISVTILYPEGKVSDIQELQLTTLGHNVKAIEISGTFDDCQALVKNAFLDTDLKSKYELASANSINISRLIPQAFYYISAYSKLKTKGKKIIFSVPSGNFGNLTAGLLAMKMGMPVCEFVATTNINKVVPEYLTSGVFEPIVPSKATISNAMDVGNPSNFPRMLEIFKNEPNEIKNHISGHWFDDEQTRSGIIELYEKYNYLACPHTAVGYLGLKKALDKHNDKPIGVFLSTAHYAKFMPEMESTLGFEPSIPDRLSALFSKQKKSEKLNANYADFKLYLERNLI
jgi:threonine synthase